MKSSSITFTDRFEEEVKRSGMSKAAIAEKIGVSKSTISRYADGTMGPNASSIAKLSLLFGCSSDYLLGLTSERNNSSVPSIGESNIYYEADENIKKLLKLTEEELESLSRKQIEEIYAFIEFQIERSKKGD
ncbi:helix-turn-helix transcriptional regulator [Exiguobacterium sp. s130]|uniref:helix-turn-helix domain-containing protein n=1 Tax=Exiguobacterium sp. s130 TaxID=2751190 RepID=UPI001BEAE139|nr:helix-turn-helix transcriptional regulator [Exiguobacterium sp. s130]